VTDFSVDGAGLGAGFAAPGARGAVTGDMDALNLRDLAGAQVAASTATSFSYVGVQASLALTGANFTYGAGRIIAGGVVTGFTYQGPALGGPGRISVTFDANSPAGAASFAQWIATGDTAAMLTTLLGGADTISGSSQADILRGYGGDDVLFGGGGADAVYGGAGDDTIAGSFFNGGGPETFDPTLLRGEDGDDSIVGGAGADDIGGDAGNDTLDGGAGDDALDGGAGNNLIYGGAGVDSVSYASATAAVTVDLQAGVATRADGHDTISDVETVIGGGFGDTVRLAPTGGTVMGGGGADTITASGGQTYLRGEAGDDTIAGGSGFDDINGNQGNDTAHGAAGDDWVVGGKDNDVLFGDAGDDIVWGNLGNDTLDGGDGNDQVRGGQGDDVLSGGAGGDYLSGDRGNDTITGGAGADTFHSFPGAGIDRVLDFRVSEGDKVMLDPGTSFTVGQVGADTVIDLGGGDQVILVGVQMSTLPPGTIFLGG